MVHVVLRLKAQGPLPVGQPALLLADSWSWVLHYISCSPYNGLIHRTTKSGTEADETASPLEVRAFLACLTDPQRRTPSFTCNKQTLPGCGLPCHVSRSKGLDLSTEFYH